MKDLYINIRLLHSIRNDVLPSNLLFKQKQRCLSGVATALEFRQKQRSLSGVEVPGLRLRSATFHGVSFMLWKAYRCREVLYSPLKVGVKKYCRRGVLKIFECLRTAGRVFKDLTKRSQFLA